MSAHIRWVAPVCLVMVLSCAEERAPYFQAVASQDCGRFLEIEPNAPTVSLLIGRSGSMSSDFDGRSRWDALRSALMNSTDGVVSRLQHDVRFGLYLYTGGGDSCPDIRMVAPATSNLYWLNNLYSNLGPGGLTPTALAVEYVTEELLALGVPGTKRVVLATDGEPNSCNDSGSTFTSLEEARMEAVVAVADAFEAGVTTSVIALGDEIGGEHLQALANVGAGYPSFSQCPDCAPAYRPTDSATLIEDLKGVVREQRNCELFINGEVDMDLAGDAMLELDGELLEFDDPDGWTMTSPSEFELTGEACTRYLELSVSYLEADFPCDIFTTPPRKSDDALRDRL